MEFPKTHYEIAKEVLKKNFSYVGITLEDLFEKINLHPSFSEFIQNPLIKDLATKIQQNEKRQFLTFTNILYHLCYMYQTHERIYYIHSGLALEFSRTKTDIDSYFLRSPFPEIYVQIDPGLYFLQDETWTAPIRGIYINLKEEKEIKWIRIMAAALKTDYSKINNNNDDFLFYFKIPISPGKIEKQVKDYIEHIKSNTAELELYGGNYNINHIHEIFIFAINTLLYLTSRDPDIILRTPKSQDHINKIKNKAKIRKFQQKINRTSSLPIIVVGSRTEKEGMLEKIRSNGGIRNWNLNRPVYVSGHWRHQWYGSGGNKIAHLIFIRPYEKGPDSSHIESRKYLIN